MLKNDLIFLHLRIVHDEISKELSIFDFDDQMISISLGLPHVSELQSEITHVHLTVNDLCDIVQKVNRLHKEVCPLSPFLDLDQVDEAPVNYHDGAIENLVLVKVNVFCVESFWLSVFELYEFFDSIAHALFLLQNDLLVSHNGGDIFVQLVLRVIEVEKIVDVCLSFLIELIDLSSHDIVIYISHFII